MNCISLEIALLYSPTDAAPQFLRNLPPVWWIRFGINCLDESA